MKVKNDHDHSSLSSNNIVKNYMQPQKPYLYEKFLGGI